MEQYNWHVGMPIIMTADSERGYAVNYKDGEYKGKVISLDADGRPQVRINNNDEWWFEKDGRCTRSYPGMSIRPADEKIGQAQSQWIEGKAPIPKERKGDIFIWGLRFDEPLYIPEYDGISVGYTHWQYVTLPPPPPAKEVEAFGYLVAVDRIEKDVQVYTDETTKIYAFYRRQENARAFYSQPATAENKKKYFNEYTFVFESEPERTLDNYINGYKGKLTFTPAALEKLGIK